ncbi:hypothetical protein FA10DRAFT_153130 [Acaromyces ingoldii]|uniref:Secreted protein n=1 Tax=Acaromyces ingoldii TaxID=215250 RepID=A0A316YFZ4_9BASI|nr:hypothetical protein FA10DRAFT_153130 [Acaromyces ingoldii]PWN88051.1 hypothetical protein FA10DRAFT_153130 [Acaromyces ingoldii]
MLLSLLPSIWLSASIEQSLAHRGVEIGCTNNGPMLDLFSTKEKIDAGLPSRSFHCCYFLHPRRWSFVRMRKFYVTACHRIGRIGLGGASTLSLCS